MGRFTAILTSILASLGLAGLVPDGPDTPQPPPGTTTERVVVTAEVDDGSDPQQAHRKTYEALIRLKGAPSEEARQALLDQLIQSYESSLANAENDNDPATVLRQTYSTLQRLRAERLDGRPGELLDRAVELYKRAVDLVNKPGEAAQQEAWGLAVASREVAQAVERLRDVQRSGQTDPYLPPPPGLQQRRSLTLRALPRTPLPPPIPPSADVVVRAIPPVPPAPPVPPSTPRITLRSQVKSQADPKGEAGKTQTRSFVLVTPGSDSKDGKSDSNHTRIFVTPDTEVVEGFPLPKEYRFEFDGKAATADIQKKLAELRAQAEAQRARAVKAEKEAMERQKEAMAKVKDITGRIHSLPPADPANEARSNLQRAHDKISAARKAAGDGKGRYFLDAARDLYNAARRDAEAGRFDRASELARAAEALTLVPQNLPGSPDSSANVRIESRVIVRDAAKAETPDPAKSEESRPSDPLADPDDQPKPDEDDQYETEIEGIGVAIGREDGHLVVQEIVPEGPAAKDGRLQQGDILVGVRKEGGEKVLFEGKPLAEIVKDLRGKAGSAVTVIVKPKGKDDTVTYELKRDRVPVPSRPESPEGGTLPPALPED